MMIGLIVLTGLVGLIAGAFLGLIAGVHVGQQALPGPLGCEHLHR